MGFVTASGSGAVGLTEYINAPADIYNCHSATAIYCYTLAGTLSASLSSLDSDGFTLYWPSTISGVTIHYLALGGTDITGAMVKTWTAKGSTGSQSITGVGFKPSVVINIGTSDTSGPPHVSAGTAWGPIDSGAMDGSGNQWARSDRFYNNCNRYELTNACIVGVDVNTGVDYQAAYTSMDSDGFTINWSKCAAAAYFYSLCLTGGSYQVGNWVKSTSAASDTITLGITPQAIFVESACMTATSSSINNEMRMFGASDGTNNHVVTTTYDVSGAYQYWDTTNSILIPATHNTTGTIGTLGSFASSQFVASYSTYDSVATEICYIAFSAASTGYTAYPAVISVESQPIIPPFTIDHTNTPTVISPEAAPIVPPFTISCSLTSVVAAAECTPINAIASLSAQLITTTVVATEAQPIDIVPSIVVVITTTVALAECNPVGATAPISAQVLTTTVVASEARENDPSFTIDASLTTTVVASEAAPISIIPSIVVVITTTVVEPVASVVDPTAPISLQTLTTVVVPIEAVPVDPTAPISVQSITLSVIGTEANIIDATAPISVQLLTTTVISPEASAVDPTAPISIQTITTVAIGTEAQIFDATAPISVQAITLSVVETEAKIVDATAPISVQLLTTSVLGTEVSQIDLIPKIDAALTTTVVATEAREIDPSFTIDCSLTLTVNETEIYAVDVSDIVIWSGTFVADFNLDERTDLKVYGIAQKSDGSPYPLDGVTIEWNMRDKHGTILVTKSTSDGSIMIEDSASGMFSFNLTTTDTDFNLEPTYERPAVCRQEARIIEGEDEYVGARGRIFVMPSQT
jgi:hypothetical protein